MQVMGRLLNAVGTTVAHGTYLNADAAKGPVAVLGTASDGYGQSSYANAQASGGQLTVQAGVTHWTPPGRYGMGETGGQRPTAGQAGPNQPYGCTYTAAPSLTAALGPSGQEPGEWMIVVCSGPGAVDPMPPIWVSDATQAAAQIDPAVVAEQAVKQLAFGCPASRWPHPTGARSWFLSQRGCGSTRWPGRP
jgi:hypothetical protein